MFFFSTVTERHKKPNDTKDVNSQKVESDSNLQILNKIEVPAVLNMPKKFEKNPLYINVVGSAS